MARFEDVADTLFDDTLTRMPNGFAALGAMLLAPVTFPMLRPITKAMVKTGIVLTHHAKEATVLGWKQCSDLIAEARTELAQTSATFQQAQGEHTQSAQPAKAGFTSIPLSIENGSEDK